MWDALLFVKLQFLAHFLACALPPTEPQIEEPLSPCHFVDPSMVVNACA